MRNQVVSKSLTRPDPAVIFQAARGRANMSRLVAVACLLMMVACGDDAPSSPTAPTPVVMSPPPQPPSARIIREPSSSGKFVRCSGGGRLPIPRTCTFLAAARNTGEGCATDVRAAVTFRDANKGVISGPKESYPLVPPSRIVRPGEVFNYEVGLVNPEGVTAYSVEFAWTTVSCHGELP